jgi:hypothetical protein
MVYKLPLFSDRRTGVRVLWPCDSSQFWKVSAVGGLLVLMSVKRESLQGLDSNS